MAKSKSEILHEIYYGPDSDFLEAYFEAALWSTAEIDEDGNMLGNLDDKYYIDDFTKESLKELIDDAEGFLDHPGVREAIEETNDDYAQAGHDFWLTRCRHGAGYWDGNWPEPQASFLTDVAHSFGDVYITPYRGKLHV